MRAAVFLAGLALGSVASSSEVASREATPAYTPSSLVNAASNEPGPLAPNTIVSLYGEDLSYVTRALQPGDIRNDRMPDVLPTTGVRVLIASVPAQIYFVSPRQVNLLIPPNLVPGKTELQLVIDGRTGPSIPIRLSAAAPALFLQAERTAIVCRSDGSLVTPKNPLRPGEIAVLYATGLGDTFPTPNYGEIPRAAARLVAPDRFRLLLAGAAVGSADLLYAGLAPGFPGLYQVNFRLPAGRGENPSVQVDVDGALSPSGISLPAAP